mmetsp:Transcript_38969/g.94319  ORF Transcript_38969/g.94319 Transcript_38969/m.94319 type:complete len:534 (+) Transcript_38969:134-1735(+)
MKFLVPYFFSSSFVSLLLLLYVSSCCHYCHCGGTVVEAFAMTSSASRKNIMDRSTSIAASTAGGGGGAAASYTGTTNGEHPQPNDDTTEDEKKPKPKPLFSMGMIADIQYAPIPDGFSYTGNPRYYEHALEVAYHAFDHFQSSQVDLVANLGDTIDGKCQDIADHGGQWPPQPPPLPSSMNNQNNNDDDNEQEQHQKDHEHPSPGRYALDHVKDAMSSYCHGPVMHSYGNHCLYNLDRAELKHHLQIPFVKEECSSNNEANVDAEKLAEHNYEQQQQQQQHQENQRHELVGYYSHDVKLRDGTDSGIRLVVIDGYDIAIMQRCDKSSQKYKAAVEILKENNPVNFEEGNVNSPEGLEGLQRRFVAFNGAVGPTQLRWFVDTLEDSRLQNRKVIVMSHNPIHPDSSNPVCLLWNYDDVLKTIRQYPDVVVACFAGHAHKGGYCRDEESGIHFRVLEAALENKPDKTYGILDVFYDQYYASKDTNNERDNQDHDDDKKACPRLVLRGFGNCESAVFDFDHVYNARPATEPRIISE